jgi:NAD(P)-dependent dehydrogenase (short-subunit alcohol dehydrogenase family)
LFADAKQGFPRTSEWDYFVAQARNGRFQEHLGSAPWSPSTLDGNRQGPIYCGQVLFLETRMMAAPSSFDLEGHAALVTGGSRGIGRAIAEALGRAGSSVAVTSRSLKALDATLAELKASGVEACAIEHDVASVEECRTAVAEAATRFGRLDLLVNNAGVEQICPSLAVDEALWDRILDTNLKGAFFSAQAAAARMKADGRGGVIINVCSLTSEVGVPTATPYGSSKSAWSA